MFFRLWHRSPVFPRLALVTCFPALGTGCMFWHALGTGCMFSRAWHRLHVLTRAWHRLHVLARAWHRLHVFTRLAPVACFDTRLAPVACFHALDTGCMFSRAWHRLHVFMRLAPVAWSPVHGTGYMRSCACCWFHVSLCSITHFILEFIHCGYKVSNLSGVNVGFLSRFFFFLPYFLFFFCRGSCLKHISNSQQQIVARFFDTSCIFFVC